MKKTKRESLDAYHHLSMFFYHGRGEGSLQKLRSRRGKILVRYRWNRLSVTISERDMSWWGESLSTESSNSISSKKRRKGPLMQLHAVKVWTVMTKLFRTLERYMIIHVPCDGNLDDAVSYLLFDGMSRSVTSELISTRSTRCSIWSDSPWSSLIRSRAIGKKNFNYRSN